MTDKHKCYNLHEKNIQPKGDSGDMTNTTLEDTEIEQAAEDIPG